jgi:Protein of unknown function (DUF3987)/RepB DNA-primase from phage plasmid
MDINLDEARRFLTALDADAEAWTFQALDDSPLKRGHLSKICHGSLDDEARRLTAWSQAGAGIFVMVNEGNGMGRRAENVTAVRAVFCDLDGAPLESVLQGPLEPHAIVESSPGRYHCYWLVEGLPLDMFTPVQKAIAKRFGGDPAVSDLPRVMRLCGFDHKKGEPFQTRFHTVNERLPYTAAEILTAFPPIKPERTKQNGAGNAHDADPTGELIRQILTGERYHEPLCALAWRHVADGMAPAKVVLTLRALMESSAGPRDDRWFARYEEIARTVGTAEQKLAGSSGVHGDGEDDAAWPEPDMSVLADHRLPAPPLPLEVFGLYWASWIRARAESKSCPVDYVAMGLLGAAGVLVGNARWGSPWADWAEPPVLWLAGVGTPSSGKSPGLDAARDVLAQLEADANLGRKEELARWDTATRAAKMHDEVWQTEVKAAVKRGAIPPPRPDAAIAPERPIRRRIITSDATVERVARLLCENPKGLLVYRDELAGWIGGLDRYGGSGSDRAFYLEGFGGRSYAVDRIRDPEPVVVPALTIGLVGGIQPDRLGTLVLSGDDDGLAARFLYVWPERVPPRRPTCNPPTGAKAKMQLLYALQGQAVETGERTVLRFSAAAAGALQAYREQVAEAEVGAAGLFLSWMGKLPGMATRLATILEHLHWVGDRETAGAPTAISEHATVAAIALLDAYALPMTKRCFGEAALPQADRDALALARWIRSQAPLPEILNARELRHVAVLSTKDPDRYDSALTELGEAGWTRPAPARSGGSAGRSRKDWAVNPKLKEVLR